MTKYNLPGVPNQTFEIQIEGVLFFFTLRTFRGSMFVDIDMDGDRIISGLRVVNEHNILPRTASDSVSGNFQFRVAGRGYPDYTLLNSGYAYMLFIPYGE